MQVSRAGLVLHLSEHHGDASPGSTLFVTMRGIDDYRRELMAKDYTYMKPGIETVPWGREMTVHDPFGNRIRFCEQDETRGARSPHSGQRAGSTAFEAISFARGNGSSGKLS